MEILGCPNVGIPLSVSLAESKGKEDPVQLEPGPLQKLPEGSAVHLPAAYGAPLLIFVGFTP